MCYQSVSQLEVFLRTHDDVVEVGGGPILFKMKRRKLSCYTTHEKNRDRCIHLLRSRRWMIFLYSPTPFTQVTLKRKLINLFKNEFYSREYFRDASPTVINPAHEMNTSTVIKVLKKALYEFPSTLIFAGM